MAGKERTMADFSSLDFEISNQTTRELEFLFDGNLITVRETGVDRYKQRKEAAKARRRELLAKGVNK